MNQTDSPAPRISMIIPAYNEEGYLPRLFNSIETARARYVHGRDAVEVIVSDNASTDSTGDLARDAGYKVAYIEKRMIGAVRNGGAAMASGGIFYFCDADMEIHPDTFNAISEAMVTDRYVSGMTGILPDFWTLKFYIIVVAVSPLILMQIARGVAIGPIFCRREDFEAIGGQNEERHIGEDGQFMNDLRALGRSQGRKTLRCRGVQARHATLRKEAKHGFLRPAVLTAFYMVVGLFRPDLSKKWIRRYWYDDRT